MAIEFLISPAVSVTNGSTTLNVTGSVDTYHVYNGTTIVIGNNPVIAVVEDVSGSGQPDMSGNSTITLAKPWGLSDVVNEPMVAFNTNEGFVQAQRDAKEAANKLLAMYGNQELLLSSTDPTVSIEISGVPTDFVPYQYLADQVASLVESASDASETLDSLEPRIDQAEADLTTIEGTLQTHETNAANSAAAASTSETNSATSEANAAVSEANAIAAFDNFDDKYLGAKASDPTVDNDGDPLQVGASYWNSTENELRFWNGATWDRPEETATQAAASAISSASAAATSEGNAATSETNAANSASAASVSETNAATSEANAATSETNAAASEVNAIDARDISLANSNFKGEWATNPDGSPRVGALNVPASIKDGNVVYMLLNNVPDITLSQPSVDTSNWFILGVIGSDAPNALKLGGELPSYYATAASVSNVDNTSDLDKPISDDTQAALDNKADQSSISNIDNTSDADKPVSTATQAALDEIETFTLAGLVL